jgi:hypothetical protein
MTTPLAHRLRRDGRSLATVASWAGEWLDAQWEQTWQQQLPQLRQLWTRIGEPAYGTYNRELFRPAQEILQQEGFTCDPRLPGNLALSEELWGPQDHRERRMWTLLLDDGRELGALVTRFFHDHTELRLPEPPTMVGLPETDHDAIRSIVIQAAERWPVPT